MSDYEHWFRETEEGKEPLPDSPAYKGEDKKPQGFVARNPSSYAEFLKERHKR